MNEQRELFIEEIMQLPVLDTHTHLVGDRLAAKDFWQIAHYFWFQRELEAAGYPSPSIEMPENERIAAFLKAYKATKPTNMNWVVTQIFKTLYGIELTDEASVLRADAAVRATAQQTSWPQQVADRLNVRAFVVNIPEHAEFEGMSRNAILVPRIDGKLNEWVNSVHGSDEPERAWNEAVASMTELLKAYAAQGCPGIMTTLPHYESQSNITYPLVKDTPKDQIMMNMLHEIAAVAQSSRLLVQLFLGVERSWCGTAVPVNDPLRIVRLSALFERYNECKFELVLASDVNNLDAVQAAWNFPNVHIGGMWWFNFRASTYRESMQYRLEASPASKNSLIVSDARCIEWSYGKIMLVKRVMGEFLHGQIDAGWIDRETALETARQWLYDSAAVRYAFQ